MNSTIPFLKNICNFLINSNRSAPYTKGNLKDIMILKNSLSSKQITNGNEEKYNSLQYKIQLRGRNLSKVISDKFTKVISN